MKHLPRAHSKKEWRKHIDKCWNVQENLQKCVVNSDEYSQLPERYRHVINKSISKGFLYDYIDFYQNGINKFSVEAKFFYDTESTYWRNKRSSLDALNQKCNLFSLYDCAEQTFKLENFDGSYEYAKRLFK